MGDSNVEVKRFEHFGRRRRIADHRIREGGAPDREALGGCGARWRERAGATHAITRPLSNSDHRPFDAQKSGAGVPGGSLPMNAFHGKIIVLSGYLTPELDAKYRALGVDRVIRKPFNADELRKDQIEESGRPRRSWKRNGANSSCCATSSRPSRRRTARPES